MKVVYVAHPIAGDVKGNTEKVIAIIREIFLKPGLSYLLPIAPYIVDIMALDDSVPENRKRCIGNDAEYFNKRFIDELWLYGDRISAGMWDEIHLARQNGIAVIPCTPETTADLLIMSLP